MLDYIDRIEAPSLPYDMDEKDWSWLENANMCDDLIFKTMLSESEDVTALLLSACGIEGKITSIRAGEAFPSFHKTVIPDITVRTKESAIISIDMQTSRKADIIERMAYYGSALYSSLLEEGEPYKKLRGKSATVIFFYVKDVFKMNKPIYTFRGKDRNTQFISIEYILVNMEKREENFLGKVVHDIFCSNPDDMYNPVLRNRLRYIKETEGGKIMMNPLLRKERIEGKREGRREGIVTGKKEVAKSLLQTTDLSLELISHATKVPIEDLKKMKENL